MISPIDQAMAYHDLIIVRDAFRESVERQKVAQDLTYRFGFEDAIYYMGRKLGLSDDQIWNIEKDVRSEKK